MPAVRGNLTAYRRVKTPTVSSATFTIDADKTDLAILLPVANFTVAAPTGTAIDAQQLGIRIRSDASARTITWNAIFLASGTVALPATTVISKTTRYTFEYDANSSKWVLLAADSTGY